MIDDPLPREVERMTRVELAELVASVLLGRSFISGHADTPEHTLACLYFGLHRRTREDYENVTLELLQQLLADSENQWFGAPGDNLIRLADPVFLTSERRDDAIDTLLAIVDSSHSDPTRVTAALQALAALNYPWDTAAWRRCYDSYGEDALGPVLAGLALHDVQIAFAFLSQVSWTDAAMSAVISFIAALSDEIGPHKVLGMLAHHLVALPPEARTTIMSLFLEVDALPSSRTPAEWRLAILELLERDADLPYGIEALLDSSTDPIAARTSLAVAFTDLTTRLAPLMAARVVPLLSLCPTPDAILSVVNMLASTTAPAANDSAQVIQLACSTSLHAAAPAIARLFVIGTSSYNPTLAELVERVLLRTLADDYPRPELLEVAFATLPPRGTEEAIAVYLQGANTTVEPIATALNRAYPPLRVREMLARVCNRTLESGVGAGANDGVPNKLLLYDPLLYDFARDIPVSSEAVIFTQDEVVDRDVESFVNFHVTRGANARTPIS